MPVLGYNGGFTSFLDLKNDTHRGHYDPNEKVNMGNPVPQMQVNAAYAYCMGPVVASGGGDAQIALYEASNPLYSLWPLVGWSQVVSFSTGDPAQWWTFPWPGPGSPSIFPAGEYMLGLLSNGAPGDWTLRSHFATYPSARRAWGFLSVPGVFNNPLGICTQTTQKWCIYIDYTDIGNGGVPRPLAACLCQPKCGEG